MFSPITVLICNSFINVSIIVDDGSRKEQLFQSQNEIMSYVVFAEKRSVVGG